MIQHIPGCDERACRCALEEVDRLGAENERLRAVLAKAGQALKQLDGWCHNECPREEMDDCDELDAGGYFCAKHSEQPCRECDVATLEDQRAAHRAEEHPTGCPKCDCGLSEVRALAWPVRAALREAGPKEPK